MLSGTNVQVLHIVNKYTNRKMVWIPGLFTRLGSYLRHNRLFFHTPIQWQYQSKGGMGMNINYIRVGDYYIPDLTLPEETRPIGKWGTDTSGLSERVQADHIAVIVTAVIDFATLCVGITANLFQVFVFSV